MFGCFERGGAARSQEPGARSQGPGASQEPGARSPEIQPVQKPLSLAVK